MSAPDVTPEDRLALLVDAAREALKRRTDLIRWARGDEPTTRYAAGLRSGLELAAQFYATGLFGDGDRAACIHNALIGKCLACEAATAEERQLTDELAILAYDRERRERRVAELARWALVYRTSRSKDGDVREYSMGVAEGIETARTYLEHGVFRTDCPPVDATTPRKVG